MAPQASTSSAPQQSTLSLTDTLMSKLKPAKIFKNSVDQTVTTPPAPGNRTQTQKLITGLCFDDRGDQLITASEDETFRLYSCKSGKHMKTLHSKKYGVDLPRFTHKNTAILHASTKEDDTIRYHSLHDNKYLQYFKGHHGRVVSLEMSPVDDGFMSGSMDNTVRVWDLRAPTCRGLLTTPGPPVVAYDSSGLVFAVAVNFYSRILLYDITNFDKAPFLIIVLDDPTLSKITFPPRPIYMTSMAFSGNGKYLLVGCSGDAHYVLDAFEGHILAKLVGHIGLERRSTNTQTGIEPQRGMSGEEVSWTPDSLYIIGGSLDGRIFVWDVQHLPVLTGPVNPSLPPVVIRPLSVMDGHPSGACRAVKFNPRLAMLATAGAELAFWVPDTASDLDGVARELLKPREDEAKNDKNRLVLS